MTLPNVFKKIRDTYDTSQSELARTAGLNQSSVSGIESSSSNPTLATIIRYVSVFTHNWKLSVTLDGTEFVIAKGTESE